MTVQNRYNLKDRASEAVLRKRARHRASASCRGTPLQHGDDAVRKALDEVASVRGGGITAGQVALAWLLAHSPVMLPIPGTGSVAHLEENMVAAELNLQPDEISAIEESIR